MSVNTKLSDWNELLTAVEGNAGIHRVTMETLRQLEGRQRVGKHILSSIEDKLKTLGLGHLPEVLPNRQQQNVLLYRVGTPASEVIQAVRDGLTEPASDTAFQYLHRLNTIPDPDTMLSRAEIGPDVREATRAVLDLLMKVQPTEDVLLGGVTSERVDIPELIKELTPVNSGQRM